MPGYSGTPLPKKLGIKDGFRVTFAGAPSDVLAELKATLAACEPARDAKATLDFAMVFTKSRVELSNDFTRTAKLPGPPRILWVSWPKAAAASRHRPDPERVCEVGLAG